jgi:hypothetical protein
MARRVRRERSGAGVGAEARRRRLANGAAPPTARYELPDGNTLELSGERFTCAEPLFVVRDDVTPWSADDDSLQSVAWRCVERADVDVRRDMFASNLLALALHYPLPTHTHELHSHS